MNKLLSPQTSRVPLPEYSIEWYRTKLDPQIFSKLHELSDVKGCIQTCGFLACLFCSLICATYYNEKGNIFLTTLFSLLYGMQANFLINGMHELGIIKLFLSLSLYRCSYLYLSLLPTLFPSFYCIYINNYKVLFKSNLILQFKIL